MSLKPVTRKGTSAMEGFFHLTLACALYRPADSSKNTVKVLPRTEMLSREWSLKFEMNTASQTKSKAKLTSKIG